VCIGPHRVPHRLAEPRSPGCQHLHHLVHVSQAVAVPTANSAKSRLSASRRARAGLLPWSQLPPGGPDRGATAANDPGRTREGSCATTAARYGRKAIRALIPGVDLGQLPQLPGALLPKRALDSHRTLTNPSQAGSISSCFVIHNLRLRALPNEFHLHPNRRQPLAL
jgi:hypothetical protein